MRSHELDALRTLIFGGAFNPVHIGHLRAAIEVSGMLGFKRVEWVPSYAPLHKTDQTLLPFELRVAMLRTTLGGHDDFHVSEIERELPTPSVTVQTLEAMAQRQPAAEHHFLLGDREFLRLPTWRAGNRVVELAHIMVVCRTEFDLEVFASQVGNAWPLSRRVPAPPGAVMAFELMPGRRAVVVAIPRIEISSSLVRTEWLEGRSVAHLVPPSVSELLALHRDAVQSAWTAPAGLSPGVAASGVGK